MRTLVAQVNLQDAYRLSPDSPDAVTDVFPTPGALITSLLPNIFIFAGLLLFFFIFFAGLKMVISPDKKKNFDEGKKKIGYAVAGFILLFMSYWLIQIIQVVTGITILG